MIKVLIYSLATAIIGLLCAIYGKRTIAWARLSYRLLGARIRAAERGEEDAQHDAQVTLTTERKRLHEIRANEFRTRADALRAKRAILVAEWQPPIENGELGKTFDSVVAAVADVRASSIAR